MEDVTRYFAPDGAIAEHLDGFETRPGQVAMARAVAEILTQGGHLMAEAGTGVGKSLAYLLPAVLLGLEAETPTVVSTHTISLQEQLLRNDIPLVRKALDQPFRAVLVKGRGNYLCVRRLAALAEGRLVLLNTKGEAADLSRIGTWAMETRDGSLSDLGFVPAPAVWALVRSESGTCTGKECRHRDRCFYFAARRRLLGAHLLVVNHALLMSDLAIRDDSGGILPRYDALVVDEAHALERAADENLGTDVSNFGIRLSLDILHNPRTGRGLFSGDDCNDLQQEIARVRETAAGFFESLRTRLDCNRETAVRIREPGFLEDTLSPPLHLLASRLGDLEFAAPDAERAAEIAGMTDRLERHARSISEVISAKGEDRAFWAETRGRGGRVVALRSAPIRAGTILEPALFGRLTASVLTSATLSTGGQDPFAYFANRLGVPHPETRAFDSPFDFTRQVTLYLGQSMPDPRSERFPEALAERVRHHLLRSKGRAFVLFTSYRLMNETAERLRGFLAEQGYALFVQGEGLPRTTLLERFREDVDSVLFGTASFWEGVDVRGDSLSNVIITRLPFAVPNHPLVQARLERVEAEGGNPFLSFTVPEAIIRLKQGFGRLVRTRADRGSVVILDPRVVTKFYGRHFLAALPECEVVRE